MRERLTSVSVRAEAEWLSYSNKGAELLFLNVIQGNSYLHKFSRNGNIKY